ncbi:uncharacterized protein LOC135168008 isoform X2 [Diachasmimorpha longicaudata]|uniref:uncharacterized protein LOC135168008 isoform X2 n=1 Tax=Diachasmimorpha longicaudata TaxID=58733 RepID=UPI0030B8A219
MASNTRNNHKSTERVRKHRILKKFRESYESKSFDSSNDEVLLEQLSSTFDKENENDWVDIDQYNLKKCMDQFHQSFSDDSSSNDIPDANFTENLTFCAENGENFTDEQNGVEEPTVVREQNAPLKAKKKFEKLYKTRSDLETDSEVDSASGFDITRKRAASILKTSYSLENFEEESIVSPKRSREDADSLSTGTHALIRSGLQSDRSMNPVQATHKAPNKMDPRSSYEDRLQELRKQNQDDPTKMFFADYLDASLALLSLNHKEELRNLRRCYQLDMDNHINELKQYIKAPMMPIGDKFVLGDHKLGMKIPLDTLEDFEKWEKLLDLDHAENVEEVTQRRAALMEFMTAETSGSNDFVKDAKTILPLFINKPVQLLYSGIGRATRGVAKKNFSKTMSYACMRVTRLYTKLSPVQTFSKPNTRSQKKK